MTSIRLRLLAGLLLTLAVGAAILGAASYRSVLQETEALFDYQLRQMALSLRDQGAIDPAQASALRDEDFDFVIQIWSADGRAIYTTRDHRGLPSRAVLGLADVAAGGQTWRTYSVAARDRVIQVAQPAGIRSRLAARAALRSVLPLLAVAPLLAAAMWWLVARGLAPLIRVTHDVQARDAESLAPLSETGLADEVAPLVRAINALLARLAGSLDAQRAFVSDAAHELRSPLTALRLQIDRARRSPDAASIEALTAGVERASRLVEQLLTLARSEAGAQVMQPEPIDLGELVRQAVADTVPYALSRQADFALQAEPGVTVRGDRAALSALVRNLADNAVRYGPPQGGEVTLEVALRQGRPTLTIDDNGPGIAPAERERVFDRFYRALRQGGEGQEGSGLGLAIVRNLAERHSALVSLGDSPAGGLRVVVQFAAPADGAA